MLKGKMNLHLYIWGASDKRGESYIKLVSELKLDDIVTVHNEWGNRKKWEEFTVNTCDITLGIFGQSAKAKNVLANKVIDGIAFRTPVITAHSSGLYNYFTGVDDIFTTGNTPEELAKTIEYVASLDYSVIKARIDMAYSIYQKNFTPHVFRERLSSYLTE
jgi:glycosyltransferase involved in cell wall biosynthesis